MTPPWKGNPTMKNLAMIASALILALASPSARAFQQPDAPEAVDEARERKVMERFLGVLEKTPRRGTALDRVYGFHVERGSLDAFLKTYQSKVAAEPNDGASWLLIGLVEAQRGRDSAAVEALRKAESTRPDDALPSYYLGQALVLVGQPDSAAEAFERALNRKPARADLLDVYQALGRVHQRAHRNDKALAVWDRLEKAFPDDPMVQEQIAHALADEGQDAPALARFEALAKSTRDRFRQVQFAMEAAELKVRLGKSPEALADFETLLGKLDPESWLYREVRRKVEEVFLRTDDLAGLATYYEKWIKKTPDDVEAMARLGRTLASQGRVGEARKWLDEAVKLAPSRRELRLALIEQLVQDRKFAEAASQYEALAKLEPNNPDVVRDWGRMLLRDVSKPEPDRKNAAAAVWRKLAPDDAKDAVAVAQAADLFRQANLSDEAIALYLRAIKLAPESTQYREYLGEYYHALKRPNDALATWRAGVEGPARNARTLGRLGEVLGGFGYRKEAVEPLTEACRLEPDDFDLRLKLADLKLALDVPLEALTELEKAEKSASAEEQTEAVMERLIRAYQASGTLASRIEGLQKSLAATPSAAGWTRLARLLEADQKSTEAARAITEATRLDPKSVPAWVATARLREAAGDLLGSTEALRTLTNLDRRSRTDYLTGIAKLESRLGRRGPALEAGRELLAAAPGNPDHHQFFAELCFQLGEPDEGLDALRRAARANPSDPKAMLTLAENLARQFRTEEAIELFWRAFAKTPDVEGKLSIVARMTDQYLQRNQLDRLLGRLERELREPNQQRELSLSLAQAHAASGDYATARLELERLLASNARDTQLLTQLSNLAEQEGDLATAAKYQKQALDLAPSAEASGRLAQLYLRAGEVSEAEAVWSRLAAENEEPARILAAVDNLLSHGKHETVLAITERMLVKQPGDWEALYREGVALDALAKPAEAARRFRSILELKLVDDEPSLLVKSRQKGSGTPAGSKSASSASARKAAGAANQFPIENRIEAVWQVRSAIKLDEQQAYYGRGNTPSVWSPPEFGQARMAALGWLYAIAQRETKQDALIKATHDAVDKAGVDPRPRWDFYYLQLVRSEGPAIFEAARDLARALPADPSAEYAYLSALPSRAFDASTRVARRNGDEEEVDKTPPLAAEDLDRALTCYRDLRKKKPDLAPTTLMSSVTTELKRAKRDAEAEAFYKEAIAASEDLNAVDAAINLVAEKGSVDDLLALQEKSERLRAGKTAVTGYGSTGQYPDAFSQVMNKRADAKAYGDVARVLDRYLASIRSSEAVARRAKATGGSSRAGRNYIMHVAKAQRYISIDYPLPNAYYDSAAIQVLRNAFELYKRDDLLSDLTTHLKSEMDRLPEAEKIYPLLALAYVSWWSDDKDEAIRLLTRASEMARGDVDLRLGLAEIQAKRGDPAEALEMVDSVETLDQKTTQRREVMALRLAVLSGDVERARKASERLFGLRLDADTQVQLAAQMNQLGMHELAEAVLARARRRAGGNASALVALMLQYQQAGKTETAFQIANQILRSSSTKQFSPYNNNREDSARNEAILVFARSGKLKELIERAETQLKAAPNSVQVMQSLADYYKADNQPEKVKETYARITKLRPDDAKLRFQIATEMLQSGDSAGAVEHFTASIKKEPSLYMYRYWEIQSAFQQAGKMEDLAKIFDEIDLKPFGNNPWAIQQIVSTMTQEEKTRDLGMKLFRKMWKTHPDSRPNMLANLDGDAVWQLPEIYDYVREAVIPAAGRTTLSPWASVDHIYSWNGDGKVTGVVTRLMEGATKQNKIDVLAKEIDEGLKRFPEWSGGRAIKAVILIRKGKVDEAKAALEELLAKDKEMPANARMIVGQELDGVKPLREIELKLYEGAIDEENNGMEYQWGPAKRLVTLYHQAGKDAEAREMVLKYARKPSDRNYGNNQAYAGYQRMTNAIAFGQQMMELGYPADAVRFYEEILGDTEAIEGTKQVYGGQDHMIQQARQQLDQALKGITAKNIGQTLLAMTPPPAVPDAKAKEKPATPPVDLVLIVNPKELDKSALTSLFSEALNSAAKSKQADIVNQVKAALEKRNEADPKDLSTAIASALVAIAEGNSDAIDRTSAKLVELVEASPLDPIPANTRPNARQRADAARQLGLWLVARECLKQDRTRKAGSILEARAIEAARRQAEGRWTLAMLREGGQAALDRGDRVAAEGLWRQMLRQVLEPPSPPKAKKGTPNASAKPKVSSTPTGGFQSGSLSLRERAGVRGASGLSTPEQARFESHWLRRDPHPNPLPVGEGARNTRLGVVALLVIAQIPPAPAASSNGPAVATLERFEQAAQIAKLASDHEMYELSVEAIRESLGAGPPVVPITLEGNQANIGIRRQNGGSLDTSALQVEQRIHTLDASWSQHKMPAKMAYEALRSAVLPEGRPGEVFLYPRPLAQGEIEKPRSVGAILVRRAVEAGQVDDLRRRIEARQNQPMAVVPSQVLAVQLAIANKDEAGAVKLLQGLADRLKRDTLQNTAELACHAAIPALDLPGASNLAMPMVEAAAKTMAGGDNNVQQTLGPLMLSIARRKFKDKKPDEARATLKAYQEKMQESSVRYGGDYSLYFRKQTLATVAAEFAKAGLVADTWETLGRFADAPTSKDYGVDPELGGALIRAVRMVVELPAAERYAMLKAWTLPTNERKSIRMLTAFVPEDRAIPATFGPMPFLSLGGVAATPTLLLEAAREAGQLEDLSAEAWKAAEAKVENGKSLLILTQLATGQTDRAATSIKARIDELKKLPVRAEGTPRNQNDERRNIEWPDYLIARAALADAKIGAPSETLARTLIGQAQTHQNWSFLSRLRRDLALHLATGRNGKLAEPAGPDPGLAHWQPVSLLTAYTHHAGSINALWAESEGIVSHIAGPQSQYLIFDYPLTGKFEISADAFLGSWAEGQLSYAGLVFEPNSGGFLFPVGHHETLSRPAKFANMGGYNRTTIQVEPGKLRVLVNGHLFHDETNPGSNSPWLAFYSSQERQTAFRNLTITGSPEIPREVRLVQGDRLEGWACGFYNESQPPRRSLGQPQQNNEGQMAPITLGDPNQYDWLAHDGVIVGRRQEELSPGATSSESRIFYHRPIRDGESITYEFLYEPGKTMAHPSLERLVFLIEPEGVKLHWMTDATEDDWTGLAADNAVDAPEFRRGNGPLPLKAGEWNKASLKLEKGVALLELNGTLIYEYPVEKANQRIFGFFHDKAKTSVKVRDVVLRGDWPTALPTNLLARRDPNPTQADRRARGMIVEDRFALLASDLVLAEARRMTPERRYEYLSAYVVTNPDHPAFRLRGDLSPSNPAPPVAGSLALADQVGSRLASGGEIEAPAMELVATAKAIGKLNELSNRVEKARPAAGQIGRGHLALLVLIYVAQGREADAEIALKQLRPLLEALGDDVQDIQRWPELVAASATLDRPGLRPSAMALLSVMDQQWRSKQRTEFAKLVRMTKARGTFLAMDEASRPSVGSAPKVAGWAPVTHADSASRGKGYPSQTWTFDSGTWTHQSGHRRDHLYLASPLRGNFEVECELTSFDWRETQLSYGALTVALQWDKKSYQLRHFGRYDGSNPIDPPFKEIGPWYAFKLVVKDGTYTAFVNDRKIHESRLPDEPDAWLSLATYGETNGGVRNLKITGSPVVPELLKLSNATKLNGWLSDYYADPGQWMKQGEEIVAAKLRDPNPLNNPSGQNDGRIAGLPGSKQESVLKYNRPMLEDGEIAYEFFHEPGKVMVHPALDRLTFLIEPDGVKIHWMTDAQYDRTGLTPENATIEPDRRRGPASPPLQPNAWNRIKLTLAGDVVTLALNDVVIYERPLESTNQRDFGLFHYADETEVRVRNVTYRGQWPRTLPAGLLGTSKAEEPRKPN
jgi:tetratricopeptide (TPR) repeat protein